jgi:Tfp pilus assembly protein PilO
MTIFKKNLFISGLVIIIFFIGLAACIIGPSVDEIKDISRKIWQQQKQLEEKYQAGQNLKKTAEELAKAQNLLPEFDRIFIQENHELEFISQLEQIAKQNNLNQKIDIDNNATESLGPNFKILYLKILLNGNYLQVLNYLTQVQKLPYYFNIQNISMTGQNFGPDKNTAAKVDVTIQGKIYWQHLAN